MAAYATSDDLARLALPSRVLEQFTEEEMAAQLQAASARADSYLRSRFELPITAWGDDLRQAVCAIAAFGLMGVRGFNPEGDPTLQENSRAAIRWLEQVGAGKATPAEMQDSSGGAAPMAPLVLSRPLRGW